MQEVIKRNIDNVLRQAYLPELINITSGKVKDTYKLGNKLLMITTDRIFCFNQILPQCIPYKGKVLNEVSRYFFRQVGINSSIKHAALNALPVKNSIHPNVTLAEYVTPIRLEMIVRGYVAGRFSEDYMTGRRTFFRTKLKNGLKPYQRLDDMLVTPVMKSEKGHDVESKDKKQVIKILSKDFELSIQEAEHISQQLEEQSRLLFEKGTNLAMSNGLVLVDTKYKFGLRKDDRLVLDDKLVLIDEVHTPDSSRYWALEDYKKGKIEEWSKEFIIQYLLSKGFSGGGKIPDLPEEIVAEASRRYIEVYERLLGRKFEFYDEPIERNLVRALKNAGYISGKLAVIIMGSKSDFCHSSKIKEELDKYGIPSILRIASVHREPSFVERIVKEYNKSIEPLVLISVAGGTDALSGTLGSLSENLVIACPPYKKSPKENLWILPQYLGNPSGSACALVPRRENVAKAVAQHFNFYL